MCCSALQRSALYAFYLASAAYAVAAVCCCVLQCVEMCCSKTPRKFSVLLDLENASSRTIAENQIPPYKFKFENIFNFNSYREMPQNWAGKAGKA